MAGQDEQGYSGLRHSVDNHYKRLIGFAALTSLFASGFELSQSRTTSVLQYPSAGELAGAAAFTARITASRSSASATAGVPPAP
ncbi:hypothetical protein [Pseudacidobacterium ailaaui]|jgi:type IV secretory pathway VirB10-like protein|uniref:hypothetical protein n=1 Tax=Pseudacidobacterium ailaaui TaxID=1382359 RepID=UPI003D806DDF